MIGDQLRNRMIIYGHPACINTAKCLQTAAEKGVDIEAKVLDMDNLSDEFLTVSPLKIGPGLNDGKFNLSGTIAIMSYLDDKGFGPSLIPRNGISRAGMYHWITVAIENVQPLLVADDVSALGTYLDAFDKGLASVAKGGFIMGDFTLADIHWTACINMLAIKGHEDQISSRTNISKWVELVKQHPSTSKEKIIPFTTIPTAEDVQNNTLRDISINV